MVAQNSPINNSWTYGIANHLKTGEAISGTLTFTGSTNLTLSSGIETVTKMIESGQLKFFLHCQAGLGSYKKEIYHEVKAIEKNSAE